MPPNRRLHSIEEERSPGFHDDKSTKPRSNSVGRMTYDSDSGRSSVSSPSATSGGRPSGGPQSPPPPPLVRGTSGLKAKYGWTPPPPATYLGGGPPPEFPELSLSWHHPEISKQVFRDQFCKAWSSTYYRLQRQEDMLRNSLRDSRKLRSLKERAGVARQQLGEELAQPPSGVVNEAFDEEEGAAVGGRREEAGAHGGMSAAEAAAASWKAGPVASGKDLRVEMDGERRALGVEQLFSLLSALRGKLGSQQSELRSLEQLFNSTKFQDAVCLHNSVQRTTRRLRGQGPAGHGPPLSAPATLSSRPVSQNSREAAAAVYDILPGVTQGSALVAARLREILDSPDMQFALMAHDLLAQCEEPLSDHPEDQHLYEKVADYGSEVANAAGGAASNIRVVKLVKHADPLGVTIRNEGEGVIVGRIVKGGAAERSGLIHEADEILEVNDTPMRGKNINEVSDLLSTLSGPLTFIIASANTMPNGDLGENRAQRQAKPNVHLIAHFNYNPEDDMYIPCPELGVSFVKGDILQVIDDSDPHWWQAYREGDQDQPLAGLIPSKTYQEQKEHHMQRYLAEANAEEEQSSGCCPMKKSSKKRRFSASAPDMGEGEDVLTYEEVLQYTPEPDRKRPIVLIGPPDVGRKELRESLMQSDGQRFAAAIPHTSRPRRDDEVDGRDYHFVPRHFFEADIRANKFVEHGQYERHFYGTSLEAIRQVYHSGRTCLLNLHPQALKILRHSDLKPFVVFIAPPNQEKLRQNAIKAGRSSNPDDLKSIIGKAREMEEKYGHFFNHIIVNSEFDRTYKDLLAEINRLDLEPQWVPADWLQ